ncbi:MAG: hypothetical protein KTR15_01525 [Phycisphaeraceae bacterium]|nr:hypothetical protein [Phycisphaeraceae bacterium]
MKRTLTTTLLALVFLLIPGVVHAGDALPELAGTWVAETINGKEPKAPSKLVMTFIDDARLASEVTQPNGKTTKVEIKYKATADGTIIMYPNPEKNPDGEKGTWEIKDGKLHIASGDDAKMVLVKQK